MRKFLISTTLAALMTTQAFAGGLAPVIPEPEPVAVPQKGGSSVSPLLIIGLLVLVGVLVSRNNDNAPVVISDIRLKDDILRVGTAANGLPLYHFRYAGLPTVYEGVMAQDVLALRPDAVVNLPFGYMGVDYGKLGMALKVVN